MFPPFLTRILQCNGAITNEPSKPFARLEDDAVMEKSGSCPRLRRRLRRGSGHPGIPDLLDSRVRGNDGQDSANCEIQGYGASEFRVDHALVPSPSSEGEGKGEGGTAKRGRVKLDYQNTHIQAGNIGILLSASFVQRL